MSTEKQPTFAELYGAVNKTMIVKDADTMLEELAKGLGVPKGIFCGDPDANLASTHYHKLEKERFENLRVKLILRGNRKIIEKVIEASMPFEFFFLFPGNVKSYVRKPIPKYNITWEDSSNEQKDNSNESAILPT